jgi:hypothetical protein
MKTLVQTAVVALAATAISNAVPASSAYVDRTTEDTVSGPQITGATGLSFEDLRVGPTGKAAVEIGPIEVPVLVAACADNCINCK